MFDEKILNKGNTRKYVQIVLRVLKECRLLSKFREYLITRDYQHFADWYVNCNGGTSKLWYDRKYYHDIFGCCNFEAYLEQQGDDSPLQLYYLTITYAALFEQELYHKEPTCNYFKDVFQYIEFIEPHLSDKSRSILQKWIDIYKIRQKQTNVKNV